MRKIKRPKIGEYVLVTKYRDKDPYDPWCVSFISEIIERENCFRYKVKDSKREWKHVFRITKEEGKAWLSAAASETMEKSDRGDDVTECSSVDEMFGKLEGKS